MEATEYEFRIFAENETGLSRPRRTPMGIKTKLSGEHDSCMSANFIYSMYCGSSRMLHTFQVKAEKI